MSGEHDHGSILKRIKITETGVSIEKVADIKPISAWTTKKPTREGFYWHREEGRYAEVVYFDGLICRYTSGESWYIQAESGEWSGPMEPPA